MASNESARSKLTGVPELDGTATDDHEVPTFSHIDEGELKKINAAAGKVIGKRRDLSINAVGIARTVFDAHTSFLTCRKCGQVTQSDVMPCESCGTLYELTVYIGNQP